MKNFVKSRFAKNSKFQKLAEIQKQYNLIGLGLRVASLGGKFLLVTILAKYLSLSELGVYGLFVTSTVFVAYFMGIEFHTYVTREVPNTPSNQQSSIISNQLLVYLCTYLIVLPSLIILFVGNFLPWLYVVHFFLIAIIVHLGQEIYRYLIALSLPTYAYLVSFLVHGAWAYLVIILALTERVEFNLQLVFVLWLISGALGVVIGGYIIYRKTAANISFQYFDWVWIRKGLLTSGLFFVNVLCFRLVDLSDRYFLQYFHGEETVGIYTLFASVSNVAQDFVFASSIATILPGMIMVWQQENLERYQSLFKKLVRSVSIVTFLIAVALVIVMMLLLFFLDRRELFSSIGVFFLLLLASITVCLAMIPHYSLYVRGHERIIMQSAIFGAVLNLGLNYLLIPAFSVIGAAVATFVSFSMIGIVKQYYNRRLVKGDLQLS